MVSRRKSVRLIYPVTVILLGAFCIFVQQARYSAISPIVKGPIAVIAGISMCCLGLWGLIAIIREDKSTKPPE